MPMSEAKKRANKKWNDANLTERYDRIQLVVPKGRKEEIKAVADQHGESVNGFINRLIDEAMARGGVSTDTSAERSSGGGFGFSPANENDIGLSRFISHAALDRITALLSDGQTAEDYIQQAIMDRIQADEAEAKSKEK